MYAWDKEAFMGYIDLHVHSNKSDGTLSPALLAAHAAERGLKAIALTDHDCVAGMPPQKNYWWTAHRLGLCPALRFPPTTKTAISTFWDFLSTQKIPNF